MTDDYLNQALRLTLQELNTKLSEESTTKNLLALQLTDCEQEKQSLLNQNEELQAQIKELEALLDVQTAPTQKGA